MNQELVRPESTALINPETFMGAAGDVRASDLKIGRIAVAQAMSKAVESEKVRKGALYDCELQMELGFRTEKPLEVIILSSHRYWLIKEKVGNEEKFLKKIPANDPNELAREEGNIRRYYHHAFVVLLPSEISDGIELPYEIAFRSTDLDAAKAISKFLLNMGRKKISSLKKVFSLTTSQRTKNDKSWFGTDIALGRDTNEEEQAFSIKWCEQLMNAKNQQTVAEDGDVHTENVRY